MKRRATQSDIDAMLARNPQLAALNPPKASLPLASASPAAFSSQNDPIQPPVGKTRNVRTTPRPKTKPEIEMNKILERRLAAGEFYQFGFETMTIECGDGFRYAPDFAVWGYSGTLTFIEVKGPFIRRTGLQAFQAAKSKYPLAVFELWQLSKGEWRKLV